MRLFLNKVIKFICYFYGTWLFLSLSINYIIYKNANFKINENIDKIIIGHSQPECAFNDSLIPNFKNLSKSAEAYFYNYQKLKKVLEQNPQIQEVFIEFNPTNIMEREDQKIWMDKYINRNLPHYYSFLEPTDHWLLLRKNYLGYQHATLKSIGTNIKRIINNNENFIDSIGGYHYLKSNKTQKILDTLTNSFQHEQIGTTANISSYDLNYLKKMVELCKERNKTVYLVRSPYHQKFVGNTYEAIFQKIKDEQYSSIPFLDFKDYKLHNDEFGDLQHLNYLGARKFSVWFNQKLQSNFDKQN